MITVEKKLFMKLIFSLIFLLLFSSCNLFDNNDPDFGVEEGYFLYDSDANKIFWDRDRNYISIDFRDGISQDSIRKILEEYGLREYTSIKHPNNVMARCLKMPAENYYSSFPIADSDKLGDRSEIVDFIFPVLIQHGDNPIQIAKEIFIHFEDISDEEKEIIVDSLIQEKNFLTDYRKSNLSGSYTVTVTKQSPSSPLEIANKLTLHPKIRFSNPNYYFFLNHN